MSEAASSSHASFAIAAPESTVARTRSSGALSQLLWWSATAGILAANLVYHSRTDPGDRLMVRRGAALEEPVSWYHAQVLDRLTFADLVVIAFALGAALHRFARGDVGFSRRASYVVLVSAATITFGVVVGLYHGGSYPFGDWRNLLVGALFAFGLWSTVLREDVDSLRFTRLFVALVAGYSAFRLFEYVRGAGEVTFFGRTTVGDYAALEYVVAAVALSLVMLRSGRTPNFWWGAVALGTAVVVLSFRRYAWIELGVVFAFFITLSVRYRHRYLVGILGVALATAVAVAASWSILPWSERFASLNIGASASSNQLAATNESHIDDIRDGLDQVRRQPILGLGVGVQWVGERTVVWKGESGMVHNGPVHVWVKFGLPGLAVFFALYAVLFRWLWRRRRGNSFSDLVALGGGIFLFGQFLVTLTIFQWAFDRPETSLLVFALLAAASPVVHTRRQRTRASREVEVWD